MLSKLANTESPLNREPPSTFLLRAVSLATSLLSLPPSHLLLPALPPSHPPSFTGSWSVGEVPSLRPDAASEL
eukprot:364602-Rhodomonas_salina.1